MTAYSLLLGLAVGLSVMFFWLGFHSARSSVVSDDHVERYLDDNPNSILREYARIDRPETPGFIERVLAPAVRDILGRLGRLTPAHNIEVLTRRLETAGRPHGLSVLNFLGLKYIVALLFGAAGFLLFSAVLKQSVSFSALFFLVFALIGFYLPNLWLGLVIRNRKTAILRALPDALDMIVVASEAGQSFDQSLKRVTTYWHNPLSEEFNRILTETRLGRTRREALTAASERVQLEEMSNLIASIIQAEELGVSIGKVLRVQADQLRVIRRQRAEELARQASIKLLFPLVFLIFPSMLAVLLGPAIPLILDVFTHVGS